MTIKLRHYCELTQRFVDEADTVNTMRGFQRFRSRNSAPRFMNSSWINNSENVVALKRHCGRIYERKETYLPLRNRLRARVEYFTQTVTYCTVLPVISLWQRQRRYQTSMQTCCRCHWCSSSSSSSSSSGSISSSRCCCCWHYKP